MTEASWQRDVNIRREERELLIRLTGKTEVSEWLATGSIEPEQ